MMSSNMQICSQVDLEIPASSSEENVLIKDEGLINPPSSVVLEDTQKPVKKQTRQWAAWTHQEEENFFSALRQVGKNFAKITYRVESKNKNQVRHYYYRLLKRMNKLLGPDLCLNAKNSKETNAAMLRWWSCLQRYSCVASKLHLKPRRFKLFLEALERQLLKDRKKTRRKRPQNENMSATPAASPSLLSKETGNDACPLKPLVDSQNTNKIGATKGTSMKRNANPNVSNKGPLPTVKNTRLKRRPAVASAAYKKWEKAAMAGVSLVADAAEQLERVLNNRTCSSDCGNIDVTPNKIYTTDGMLPHQIRETVLQPSMKLKLQLFPVDEATRNVLEKDAHNPHLELTLSARKRISSVLEHLNRKWGKSNTAVGELVLLPYNIQQEDMSNYPRWTLKDVDATAADVYASVGTPIFRLRYGWYSIASDGSGQLDNCIHAKATERGQSDDVYSMEPAPPIGQISQITIDLKDQPKSEIAPFPSVIGSAEPMLSAVEWADSLTTVSVGELLSEASNTCVNSSSVGRDTQGFQHNLFSFDSFDAAIAAHVSAQQSPSTSIWNAEETCDEFSFKRVHTFIGESSNAYVGAGIQNASQDSLGLEGLFESGPSDEKVDLSCKDKTIEHESGKRLQYFDDKCDPGCHTDSFWADSLGLLDLDMPSSRYHGHDLIVGDSLGFGGLSRAIASSLDAFQNCSFFGIGKKDVSASEA